MNKAKEMLDIDLERLSLGELPKERMAAAEKTLKDPNAEARLATLLASNEEILEAYPPRVMAAQIEERLQRVNDKSRASRVRLLVPSLAAAAAAAFLVLTFVPKEGPRSPQDTPGIRLKGPMTPSLFVFRKGASKDEFLTKGQGAKPGDVVQLKYNAKGATHGVIFSIDGRGTVTLHYPSDRSGSTVLPGDGTRAQALDFSYELDDAPKFERFFFVTSDKALNVDDVLEKAESLGARETGELPLGAELSQCDFVLKKTSRAI